MLTIKTHLKSLVTSSLYLSNVGTLVLRSISLGRVHPSFAKEGTSLAQNVLRRNTLASITVPGAPATPVDRWHRADLFWAPS